MSDKNLKILEKSFRFLHHRTETFPEPVEIEGDG